MAEARSGLLKRLEREARDLRAREDWSERAIEANTRILEVDPGNLAALTRRARCHRERGDLLAAKQDYARALRLSPENANVKAALEELKREAQDAPGGGRVRSAKARTKSAQEKTREALTRIRSRAEAKESRRRQRAEAKRAEAARKRERERARPEDLRRIESLTSFEEARAVGRAARNARHPDYVLAVAALRKAFKLAPQRRGILTELAATYRASSQLEKAEKLYLWILDNHPNSAARVGLAAVYGDQGKHVKALKLYEEVLAREPGNPYALRGIARAYSDLGRHDEAAEAYEEAADGGVLAVNDLANLSKIRATLEARNKTERVGWIDAVIERFGAD